MKCKGIHSCTNENKKIHTQELLKTKLKNVDVKWLKKLLLFFV